MFIFSFTDPQGQAHSDAIIQIEMSNYNANENHSYNSQITPQMIEQAAKLAQELFKTNGDPSLYPVGTTFENEDNNINYRVLYWHDKNALFEGYLPYLLLNKDTGTIDFFASGLGDDYDGLTAEEKAEKHCKEVVLANLK